MNERCLLIMEHCRKDYVPLKSLTSQIPRSSLYVYIKELIRNGYLNKRKKEYKTTERGLKTLAEKESSEEGGPEGSHRVEGIQEEGERLGGTDLSTQVLQLMASEGDGHLNYDEKMAKLKEKLDKICVGISDVEGFIEMHQTLTSLGFTGELAIEFAEEMVKKGLNGREMAGRYEECLQEYCSLENAISLRTKECKELQQSIDSMNAKVSELKEEISSLGSTPRRIHSLMELDSKLREANITLPDVKRFFTVHVKLQRLGFDSDAADVLAVELKKTKLGIKDAIRTIVGYAELFSDLERARKDLLREKKSKLKEIRDLDKECKRLASNESMILENIERLDGRWKELKSDFSDLEEKKRLEEGALRKVQQDVARILKVKNDVERIVECIEDLRTKKVALEKEIGEERKSLDEVQLLGGQLSADILAYKGWREFLLSKKLPAYEWGFWDDIDALLRIRRGEADHIKVFEIPIAERVWERMLGYHEKLVDENVVSKWEHERLKRHAENLDRCLGEAKDIARKLREENEKLF
jgi:chromosome segregation ATPase